MKDQHLTIHWPLIGMSLRNARRYECGLQRYNVSRNTYLHLHFFSLKFNLGNEDLNKWLIFPAHTKQDLASHLNRNRDVSSCVSVSHPGLRYPHCGNFLCNSLIWRCQTITVGLELQLVLLPALQNNLKAEVWFAVTGHAGRFTVLVSRRIICVTSQNKVLCQKIPNHEIYSLRQTNLL